MSDWIDKLRQDHQLKKSDLGGMRAVKEAAQSLMPALLKQIEQDVRYFDQQFVDHRRFKGPAKTSTGSWLLITDSFPAHSLEYRISDTAVVFEHEKWATSDSAKQKRGGIIQLKAEINTGAWFEYLGEKLLRVEDVSKFLLEEFLGKMVK
jgi:hypothetical protein